MITKTIQTRNILISVIEKADKRAIAEGLSSIQDAVRIFLTNYADGKIQIKFTSEISKDKENMYEKEAEEHEKRLASGKAKSYTNTKDLFKALDNE
jgi:hypothetical protein